MDLATLAPLLLAQRDLFGHGDLWATVEPSVSAVVLVILVAGAGLVGVLYLVRGEQEEDERDGQGEVAGGAAQRSAVGAPGPAASGPLAEEVAALGRARERLTLALAQTSGPLRGALTSLIEGPLVGYDQRVQALLGSAGSFEPRPADAARLNAEERRLAAELDGELDPRARALLEASLRDVAQAKRVDAGLARNARLARLELGRMRTLLEALPARVQELAGRAALGGDELGDVEAIALQLEEAVQSTSDVLEEVLRAPADPLRAVAPGFASQTSLHDPAEALPAATLPSLRDEAGASPAAARAHRLETRTALSLKEAP